MIVTVRNWFDRLPPSKQAAVETCRDQAIERGRHSRRYRLLDSEAAVGVDHHPLQMGLPRLRLTPELTVSQAADVAV
ncbi:hypothetical protein [Amycolatopsis sp. SID8362]|uniref:hypothetical protein n=1 Tax=Amycolatopsis sp. SID8362 TaxID=2690346 RepID=UPI001368638C|nr:hypothetical protein [Amycolatopsis sp. SID8362]NBH04573.1 hypothetical protein [Amycolatopsis sp. SID8362]NED41272.1 hypothetical protein [Amycolatopsis sp. SID8362]